MNSKALWLALLLPVCGCFGAVWTFEAGSEPPPITDAAALDFTSAKAVTIQVEVKIPPSAFRNGVRQMILARGSDTSVNGWNFSWISGPDQPNAGQRLSFNIALADKKYHRFAVPAKIRLEVWTTLSVTCDGNKLALYQDGHLLGEKEIGTMIPTGSAPLRLGRYPLNSNPMPFEGEIRKVEIVPELKAPAVVGKLELPELHYRNFDLADKSVPAPAAEPFSITADQVALAKRNIANYPWAKAEEKKIFAEADALLALTPEKLKWQIPDLPGSACSCPNCGQPSNVAWGESGANDGEKLVCADCKTVFPNDKFPEDQVLELTLANGRQVKMNYFRGKKDQLNEGDRYFLSGVMRERRIVSLMNKLPSLYAAWALTSDRKYAEKVKEILLRFAEVYPGYPARLRNTYFADYGGNPIEGKFYRWKLGDNRYMVPLVTAYDLTRGSGVYSDADKLKIENDLFREYKRMMVAYPPWRDLTNSLPFGYAGMAYAGRVLGDHEMIAWVVDGPQSLNVFMDTWFHRDGFWHENSCSYQSMTLGYMHRILEALAGYSDPASYTKMDRFDRLDVAAKLPMLGKSYSSMVPALMPNKLLPGVNDSPANSRYYPRHLESAVRFYDSPEAREALRFLGGDEEPGLPGVESLFTFSPIDAKGGETVPWRARESILLPGPRWMIARSAEYGPKGGALLFDYGEQYIYHVHTSSLNFLYFDYGVELATDIGYLSAQHKMTPFNKSMMAHQTVIIDGKPHYKGADRRVDGDLFAARNPVCKVVRGSAPNVAGEVARKFERTMFYIDRGVGDRYVADFFEVDGGKSHSYIFHGVGEDFTLPAGLKTEPVDAASLFDKATGASHLTDGRTGKISGGEVLLWRDAGNAPVGLAYRIPINFSAELITAKAPGNRDLRDPLSAKKMNLMILRKDGPANFFGGVFEGFADSPRSDRQVSILEAVNGRIIEVKTGGRTELLISSDGKGAVRAPAYPELKFTAFAGAVTLEGGKLAALFVSGGSLAYGREQVEAPVVRGKVAAFDEAKRTMTLDVEPGPAVGAGDYIRILNRRDGFYRIEKIEGKTLSITDTAPWKLDAGDEFIIIPSAWK